MEKIIFKEYELEGNRILGHVCLSRSSALNVLDKEMAQLLKSYLEKWQRRDEVVAVFLEGAGEKSFCAGGDVKSLYFHMKNGEMTKVREYFQVEYALDEFIHQFSKPIIVWGDGVLMGGGIGMFAGASHRIVTEKTIMAMPEISIGFFPDVAASYFLNLMPFGLGRLIGVTGARFSGLDGVCLGIADMLIKSFQRGKILEALKKASWSEGEAACVVDDTLLLFQELVEEKNSEIFRDLEHLKPLCIEDDFFKFVELLKENHLSSWLNSAKSVFFEGSPLSIRVTWEQLLRGQEMSLAEAFSFEMSLACKFAMSGEFEEGVRALLVDKDRAPKWSHESFAEVSDKTLDSFFN